MEDWQTFGLIFENLCLRDLTVYARAHELARPIPVRYYRDDSGLEVDAIVELADRTLGRFRDQNQRKQSRSRSRQSQTASQETLREPSRPDEAPRLHGRYHGDRQVRSRRRGGNLRHPHPRTDGLSGQAAHINLSINKGRK